jgi:hypothetical protein
MLIVVLLLRKWNKYTPTKNHVIRVVRRLSNVFRSTERRNELTTASYKSRHLTLSKISTRNGRFRWSITVFLMGETKSSFACPEKPKL